MSLSSSNSLFTNSNWFAFEDNKTNNDDLTGAPASASPGSEGGLEDETHNAEAELDPATTSPVPETKPDLPSTAAEISSEDAKRTDVSSQAENKPPEWVQWRETSSSGVDSESEKTPLPDAAPEEPSESQADNTSLNTTDPSPAPDESNQQQPTVQENPPSVETSSEAEKKEQV